MRRLVTSRTARVAGALFSLCLLLSSCDIGPPVQLEDPDTSVHNDGQSRSGDKGPNRSGGDDDEDQPADGPAPVPPGSGGGAESADGLPDSHCDHTFSGDVSDASGFTVPPSETWCFNPDMTTVVEVSANVVVEGKLQMRPASAAIDHTLRFVDIDENRIVGGHTLTPVESDVGLWVVGDGQLDLQGTPKAAWNRTGTDPTWGTADELVETPMSPGDWQTFAAFDGTVDTSTAPDGTVHKAEVLNLTRNVRIHGGGSNPADILATDGRAHVFIHSKKTQTIRHAELRYVGPRAPHGRDGTDGAGGRYGLHFHLSGDGSRGSVVEGTVLRDFGSKGYVPHTSHGITFTDTIAYDGWETAYWWDPDAETHDVVYDRAVAAKISPHPSFRGYDIHGFTLGEGMNMTVADSVAVGVGSRKVNAGGFAWPSSANGSNNVWEFRGNVAHNNRDGGLVSWQNDPNEHDVEDSVSFGNGGPGISLGAYRNGYHYTGVDTWDNAIGIAQHALSKDGADHRGIQFANMAVDGVTISSHNQPSTAQVVYHDVTITGSVTVDERSGKGGIIRFESTDRASDLTPADFTVLGCQSTITVDNSDGSSFQVCP